MKEKILDYLMVISGIFMVVYIFLFFMPEDHKLKKNFIQEKIHLSKEKIFSFEKNEEKKQISNKTNFGSNKRLKVTTQTNTNVQSDNSTASVSTPNRTYWMVPVYKPIPLSYKLKQEIFDIRKEYVSKSPFAYEGYEPSEEVFGQIEDSKPWISQRSCRWKETGIRATDGPSSVSLPIINPTALVLLNFAFTPYYCEYVPDHCKFDFWPTKINYSKSKKIVHVVYKMFEHIEPQKKKYYLFNGLNARDFGYKYAYLDLKKSTFVPEFVENENISTRVVEFQDFIHVGDSCRVEGGCNNHSPDDPNMRIYYSTLKSTYNNRLYIKLWKEMPNSPEDEPDMVEILQIDYM